MEFPNPGDDAQAFLRHLKVTNLPFAVNAFEHYLTRPADLTKRLDEGAATSWCERMDTLLVSVFIKSNMTYI
jgi:hypothetical protein